MYNLGFAVLILLAVFMLAAYPYRWVDVFSSGVLILSLAAAVWLRMRKYHVELFIIAIFVILLFTFMFPNVPAQYVTSRRPASQ
jgi:hypothetical protein